LVMPSGVVIMIKSWGDKVMGSVIKSWGQ